MAELKGGSTVGGYTIWHRGNFDPASFLSSGGNAATASKLETARTLSITGDAAWTVSFDGSANVTAGLTLANSGVTAGTYTKVTVDSKGRVTTGASLAAADIPSLDAAKITTGTFAVARGGTGLSAAVQGAVLYGSSTSATAFTAAGTSGQVLRSNGTSAPTWATLSLQEMQTEWVKSAVVCATTTDVGATSVTSNKLSGFAGIAVNCTTTSGSTTVTVPSTDNLSVGSTVMIATVNIPAGTVVESILSSTAFNVTPRNPIITTLITGNGLIATATFNQEQYTPFAVGSTINVFGTTHQGQYTVSACTTTSVSWYSPVTDTVTYPDFATISGVITDGTGTLTRFSYTDGSVLKIDGISLLNGNRVLVKDQSSAQQNGIYSYSVVTGGEVTRWNLDRSTDADTLAKIASAAVSVRSGTTNVGTLWTTTFGSGSTLGTTAMLWYNVVTTNMASSVVGSTPGTAAAGTSLKYARADHVHPLQATVADVAGGSANQILYQTAANTTDYLTAPTTANTFLKWSGSAFTWSALAATDIPSLDTSKITTGTLGVARGGTGLSAAVQGAVLYGSSTSATAFTAAGTSGQVLRSNGTSAPTWATLDLTYLPDAAVKKSVRAATTANITLSGTQTVDGIALVAGDRVLVKDQTSTATNGIYVVAAGAWTRATDADTASEIAGAIVNVDSGTANGGLRFDTDFKATDTLGTTALTWQRVVDTGMASTVVGSTPGTAAVGTSLNYARADHVHPVQTTITGNAATATKLAAPVNINGVAFDGSASITVEDSTKAPLASPALTGTPTAPTATDGTNTTQLATTAFVQNTVGGYLSKTGLTGGTVALTDTEVSNAVLYFAGTLTSNLVITVPTTNKRLWSVINGTTGAFTLTVKTPSGTGVTIAQGKRNLIYTDGTNVQDAFNDFESIALTGTPTSTTAAVGTNTTQIATTAFVNAEIANDAPTKTGTGASGTWGISVTGNAATATKLQTARTISVSGDVTGSVSFDGSSNVTLSATLPAGNSQFIGTQAVKAIYYNAQTIDENVTIPGTVNAMSAGPITISDGFTVTIETGATWTVV